MDAEYVRALNLKVGEEEDDGRGKLSFRLYISVPYYNSHVLSTCKSLGHKDEEMLGPRVDNGF